MKTLSNKTKLNSILLYIEGLNLYYWRVSISCPKIFLYILNGISLDCHTCLNQANWVDISNNIFWFIIENNYFIFINYYFYIIFTFIFEKKKSSKTTNHTCRFLFQWRIIWELKIWVPLKYYLYNSVRTDGHLFILHYLFLAQYRCSALHWLLQYIWALLSLIM